MYSAFIRGPATGVNVEDGKGV
ncbi:MAG: hypothetical protein G01um1014107_258, partial [Parcubacteria group bacterium Gr01-1014_107]